MILDTLAQAAGYQAVHRDFARAFAFLRRPDLASLPAGRQEIDGDRLYAMIVRGQGVGKEKGVLEVHRRYIDIQYAVAGTDLCGWSPLAQCRGVRQGYEADKDCALFDDPPQAWVSLPPGSFAVFFPADAHAPMAGQGALHKVIVKVAVDGK